MVAPKTVKKSPVKKSPVKKSPVKKSPVKKSPVKKSPVKKSPKNNFEMYKGLFQDWCDIEPSDCEFMQPKVKDRKSPKKSPIRIDRKSPPYHANEFRVGTKMQGVDGNMWKIIMITKKDGSKYKRWSKI